MCKFSHLFKCNFSFAHKFRENYIEKEVIFENPIFEQSKIIFSL